MNLFGKETAGGLSRTREQNSRASESLKGIRGARILLVEDNKINQQVAAELLENAELLVEVANNGREAVSVAETSDFDLVIMDVQMPEMDGYEATKEIRKLEARNPGPRVPDDLPSDDLRPSPAARRLPIVAMTAHAMTGERERCLEAGMDDYVTKPIDPDQLFSVLVRWIDPEEREIPGPRHKKTDRGEVPAFPEILSGIDTESGLRRIAGNRKLYIKLLTEFCEDYADAADVIRQILDRGDTEHAKRLTHTIKGVAGNMGAADLCAAVCELESGIIKSRLDYDDVLLYNFEEALNQVLQSVETLKEADARILPNAERSDPADISEIKPFLAELAVLIQEGDAESLEQMDALKDYLADSGFEEQTALLEEQLNNYDFDEAQETLATLAFDLDLDLDLDRMDSE